ncbi:ATP-binding protein [Martelella soudanensis]|uniref:ATP-binding protein n=1 Tax=unclassified Martelella TaxID=2629616 RepID=UPI0015DE37A4|nr:MULTISPECIES: ATP-binding protein [unclassified Martelella]
MAAIKRRERDTIIQALRAGVVPRLGLQHIQVGRAREIEELVRDMERIAEGGSAIRFVIGEYGSGKTFFLNLIRLVALEKGLIVMSADLAPDRRLHATGGQARSLYSEMARNLSSRTKPDGGAMASVVERFVSQLQRDAEKQDKATGELIRERLAHFEEMTNGFEFAEVIRNYWEGHETGDEELKSAALRWLRGEFATRTDARNALGVRTIIDDANVYDHLKLMSAFVCEAGYSGLLVSLDEMVNLFKLTSSQARNANYEQILRILNDVLQGSASHLGFIMGGTPEFLMNTRRGLYSYEALQSRLAENSFARDGLVDLSGPVVRLSSLTPEDLFVLLSKVNLIAHDEGQQLPDAALEAFMRHCSERIGEAYFRTPRNTVTAFVNLVAVLQQNPGTEWSDLIEEIEIANDTGDDMSDIEDGAGVAPQSDDELSSFKLG